MQCNCTIAYANSCFRPAQSGKLLLGFTKQLCTAALDKEGRAGTLDVTPLVSVEAALASTRINDGRTDRAGNFVFGTLNEDPRRAPIGSFYQYSKGYGLRRLDLGGVAIPGAPGSRPLQVTVQ